MISVWGRAITSEDVARTVGFQHDLVARWGRFVVVSIFRAGVDTSIDEGVRESGQDALREFADTQIGSALVIEDGGLRVIMIRTVLTSIQLLSRSPIKQRAFVDLSPALTWLLGLPRVDPSLAHMTTAATEAARALSEECVVISPSSP